MIRDTHTKPSRALPAGSTDCHMHVFGPLGKYPCAPRRSYTPREARLDQWESMARHVGLERQVLVQASAYGTDNSCMLDAMEAAGGRCRGVAVIDAATSTQELEAMHRQGVRGVRVNAATFGENDSSAILDHVKWAAERVAPLGWHVQIFTRLGVIDALADQLKQLPAPLVIDHMGLARAELGVTQPGFARLLGLLKSGRCWVKISGAYRVSSVAPDFPDAAPLAQALLDANSERIVWGSDWPHTGEHKGEAHDGAPPVIDYRPLDNGVLVNLLIDWCRDESTLRRVLVDNPAELYGFPGAHAYA
jgi:predicted TIM-barrel fold metal-dependent hydrolase